MATHGSIPAFIMVLADPFCRVNKSYYIIIITIIVIIEYITFGLSFRIRVYFLFQGRLNVTVSKQY